MRKPTLLPSFTPLRLTFLGLAIVMTVLALLPLQAEPVFTQQGCFQYCEDWHWSPNCCNGNKQVQERTCTDGIGNYCTEYRCSTLICAQ
jgi:hypothetical protein